MDTFATGLGSSIDHQRVWDLGYEILERTNSLPHSDVWRIRHRTTFAECLWKQLRPKWEADLRARRMLENEAAVGQLVRHPLFLTLVDTHLVQAPRYVIWECFESQTLEQLVRDQGRLPIRLALWICRQCAEGLDALRYAGVTHGDLSLDHVLVDPRTGLVKLTGLGSARRLLVASRIERERKQGSSGPLADYEAVVAAAHLQGTARDLYQLGAILYESLTGYPPFEAETPAEMLMGRRVNVAEDLRRLRPEVAPAIADLASRLLSLKPEEQIKWPLELIEQLIELEINELAGRCRFPT